MVTKTSERLLGIVAFVIAAAVAPASAFAQTQSAPDVETARTAYAGAQPQEAALKKMSTVDQLRAMEDIRLLPLRYSRCITQKDWGCLRDDVFAADFYYGDGDRRVHEWGGFIDVMKRSGCYDRLFCRVNIHGHEIELVTPTLARGIAAADFTYWYPLGQNFPTTGTEVVPPGQESTTPSYYYQTYVKVDGKWRLRTSDHISFDLRRSFGPRTVIFDRAYVTPDGVPPYKR